MKNVFCIVFIITSAHIYSQQQTRVIVLSELTGSPIKGATVGVEGLDSAFVTDVQGASSFPYNGKSAVLNISATGYENKSVSVEGTITGALKVYLLTAAREIEAVNIQTGYQRIPKDRATGSFSTVNNAVLNQQVTTNITERISGIANGVMSDNGTSQTKSQIMVRGLSSIKGPKSPLIVVDNFPYDGDISTINPHTVENITILKDASASSIWGARAANGVIVITTKNSAVNKPLTVNFGLTTSVTDRPDLSYIKQISSSDFIELETELFKQGFYNSDITSTRKIVISPVVDLLDKMKKGTIDQNLALQKIESYKKLDVRNDFRKFMYKPAFSKQYFLDFSGGSSKLSWFSAIGYDDTENNLGEKFKRMNFMTKNSWKASDKLQMILGVNLVNTDSESGRLAYGSLNMKNGNLLPYARLADENGNTITVFSGYNQNYKDSFLGSKLLDWNYYPLTDWSHNISDSKNTELTINSGINYKILQGLDVDVKFQHQRNNANYNLNFDELSYYTRNLINTYSQIKTDGSVVYGIPKGGILDKTNSNILSNSLRTQLNYNRSFGKNQVIALMGGEVRSSESTSNYMRYFGYDPETLSFGTIDYKFSYPMIMGGTSTVTNNDGISKFVHRFVSAFGNVAYTFDKRYTLTASSRNDASNLFGLKSRDQWNPFWSVGLLWNINNEKFYDIEWLPELRLRTSYGYNGNIDPSMVAVTTTVYTSTNPIYQGTPAARFQNYYNPNLKWETIGMFNIGLDFGLANDRLSGSVEFFQKKGDNLFGQSSMDYTTGITTLLWNVAGIKGNGLDIELKSLNINRTFKWNSALNFSNYKDQVTKYYLSNPVARQFVLPTVTISGMEGYPVYSVFGYKWAGLDPETGDPRGYIGGEISKDYAKIMNEDIKTLKFFGSAVPQTYGSLINSFSYKNIGLDIGILYKFNYWFRRKSVNYTNLYRDWLGHSDYSLRWQKPGDENTTYVPSNTFKTNSNRDSFYAGSEILVEKGDHIRLQYINLTYNLSKNNLTSLPLENLQMFLNVSNLGLLWKANKSGLDPDYALGNFPLARPATFSFGIKTKF